MFFTEFIDIKNFKDAEGVDYEERYKPSGVSFACCFPKGNAFPDDRPCGQEKEKKSPDESGKKSPERASDLAILNIGHPMHIFDMNVTARIMMLLPA